MPIDVLFEAKKLEPFALIGELVFEEKFLGIVDNFPTRRRPVPFESVELFNGNDKTLRVLVRDQDQNIIDLTDASAKLTVKEEKGGVIIFQKGTDAPAEAQIGAADEGEVFFFIVPADTSALDIRQYVFDAEVVLSNGKRYTVLEGVLNLRQTVG